MAESREHKAARLLADAVNDNRFNMVHFSACVQGLDRQSQREVFKLMLHLLKGWGEDNYFGNVAGSAPDVSEAAGHLNGAYVAYKLLNGDWFGV